LDIDEITSETLESFEIFPWSADFETGIAQVDEQHQVLVRLLNKAARELVLHDLAPTAVDHVMAGLSDYVRVHFASEEALMRPVLDGDPIEQEHRAAHQSFMTEVARLKADALRQSPSTSIERIVAFLARWLGFHILDTDRRMARVILNIEAGLDVASAKQAADREMSGAIRVLIDALLRMYEKLSSRTFLLMKEVAERLTTESALRRAAVVFEGSQDAIFVTDATGRMTDANPAFCTLFGTMRDSLLGISVGSLIDDTANTGFMAISLDAQRAGLWNGQVRLIRQDGYPVSMWLNLSPVRGSDQEVGSYVGVMSNVEQLMARQDNLERMARHDSLTELPNRGFLEERLRQAVAQARRNDTFLAVCYLDLDGFKEVNDQLGHASGDELLRVIGARFRSLVRANDTVARIGGDEFALLFGELSAPEECTPMLERILHDIGQAIELPNGSTAVTASIGVTIFPVDHSDPDKLLQHADLAMYRAKRDGKSRYFIYSPQPAGSGGA
jgi:diguanylate cyclase (GGDEF)-like protein/hemerythrin-like metal-binding protein/PAS domain S-box-containing protein